jgi:hypothetical protein
MAKIKRAKNVPKPFVLQKLATIQNNLDNNFCLLVFGNWFGITEMATDRKVKSTKNVPKPPKS